MAKQKGDYSEDLLETTESKLLAAEVEDDRNVEDETESAGGAGSSSRFAITSFGADLSVFDLTRRLGKEILIPAPFQRKFVWTPKLASRFVESILLGLPVPGIFVFEKDKKQLIVDGQQRLITLSRYLSGVWERKSRKQGNKESEVVTPFKLVDVAEPWNGKTFGELEKSDQHSIENYLIHATMFRQDHPKGRERSIYEVFERINTGGLRLSPQEIRACVSQGKFTAFLTDLADNPVWRDVYGKRSPRLKDEELILRFFALLDRREKYARPMKVFLDDYLEDNREIADANASSLKVSLLETLSLLYAAIGKRLFRPENALNAAVFDSVLIGFNERRRKGPISEAGRIAVLYEQLLANENFQKSYKRATADEESVKKRIELAIDSFATLI